MKIISQIISLMSIQRVDKGEIYVVKAKLREQEWLENKKWHTNLSVSNKLLLNFFITFVVVVVIFFIGTVSTTEVNKYMAMKASETASCMNKVSTISKSFDEIRVSLYEMAMTEDVGHRSGLQQQIATDFSVIQDNINAYKKDLENKGNGNSDEHAGLVTLGSDIEKYNTIQKDFVGSLQNQSEDPVLVLKTFLSQSDVLIQTIVKDVQFMYQANVDSVNQDSEAATRLTDKYNVASIILIIIGFMLLVYSLYKCLKSIASPIKAMTIAADKIAAGDLQVDIRYTAKDEIGMLSRSIVKVGQTLGNLTTDLYTMANKHQEGESDVKVLEDKYSGAYKQVASGFNAMASNYVGDVIEIINCIKKFGEGDFNAPIKEFPNQKQQINIAIEEVRSQLKQVSSEINKLIVHATNGELDIRTESNKFSGDWLALLTSVDSLLDSIVDPLHECSNVLGDISVGKLDSKVIGNYSGEFDKIKHSVNNTVDTLSDYIQEISHVLSEISNKNLVVTIDKDYIGSFSNIKQSLNRITENLNRILGDIASATNNVAVGTNEIVDASTQVAENVRNQSAIIQELLIEISKINEQIKGNEENTALASEQSKKARQAAEQGNLQMKEMLSSMNEINVASDNISKIIKVIEDIAFQTNLLALNASVEAARAGEHGKGFAVVAAEVRNLAEKSQTAAQETAVLIQDSISKTNQGVKTANVAASALEEIVSGAAVVSEIITDISAKTAEQTKGISNINQGIEEISRSTIYNANCAEENSASAVEISAMSDELMKAVHLFKLKK